MESNDQDPCIDCFNCLHLHICMVRWWPNCLPFISHQYKSGKESHLPYDANTLRVSLTV